MAIKSVKRKSCGRCKAYKISSLFLVWCFSTLRNRSWKPFAQHKELSSLNSCSHDASIFPINVTLRAVHDIYSEVGINIEAQIMHADFGKSFQFGVFNESVRMSYCEKLHPDIWIECSLLSKTTLSALTHPQQETHQHKPYQFSAERSYIASIDCAFAELWGATHADVPGAVFDQIRSFTPQRYARKAKTDYAPEGISRFTQVAVALYPYPEAQGHFVHETLPKVLWLLRELPLDVAIVAPRSSSTEKYYRLLAENGLNVSRIIPFQNIASSVLFAQKIFFVGEWPFLHQEGNPNAAGEPTEYPHELMRLVHNAFKQTRRLNHDRNVILVIDRGHQARNILEHGSMLALIREIYEPEGFLVRTFSEADFAAPLATHRDMFNSALVVVGPHGAGFSNIVFCEPGTAIIEIGFDRVEDMFMDEMYYQLALGLHLRYWLVLGQGSYRSAISVDIHAVISSIENALRGDQPNRI